MDVLAMVIQWLKRHGKSVALAAKQTHILALLYTGQELSDQEHFWYPNIACLALTREPQRTRESRAAALAQAAPRDTVRQRSVWCEWLHCGRRLCILRMCGIAKLFP